MFEIWSAEQYRAASDDELQARREVVVSELENSESEVAFDALKAECDLLNVERSRREAALEMRKASAVAVASGAGNVIARMGNKSAKPVCSDRFDTDEYRHAFMEYVCRGTAIPMELRADEVTTTNDVPVMIPTTLQNRIVEKMEEYGDIWNRVTKMNVQGGIEFPVLDLKPTASWVGETEVSDYQKLTADAKVSFLFYQLECRLAQSILASVATLAEFQARFVPLVAEAMVKALEAAIISGDGSGKFLGITADERIENVVAMSEEDLSDWKQWHKKVKAAMPKAYRNGEFIMSQASFDAYIETMSDDNNAPVSIGYNPVTGEEENRLMGKRVTTVESGLLPDFDSADEGDVIAIYGDLAQYVVNSQMQIDTVRWIDHDTNQVKTKAMLIADGKVLDPYGFILIKKGASA